MVSIIIPAHNEEKVIGANLAALMPGVESGLIKVVVVCNGCTDNTALIVRKYGKKITCLETSVASKTNALNIGDNAAHSFPRIYLDADVRLSSESALEIARGLQQDDYLAASPVLRMDYSSASWFVKSYYEIWQQLPYVKEGMIGTGVFALSEKARKRFPEFPDVIADDGFVRSLFTCSERVSIAHCYCLVSSPINMNGLIKIKTRSRLGRYELAEKFPDLLQNEKKSYWAGSIKLLCKGHNWFKLPIYLYVNILTRIRAKRYIQKNGFSGWERDESSRDKPRSTNFV